MATVPFSPAASRGEARFFFVMACVMAATIVGGFSLNIVLGRSTFASPLLVHFHAVVMMGWVALYLAQTGLVFTDNVALHRRLGWVAAVWMPLMVISGVMITRYTMQERGGPPFFDQNQFLFSNPLQLLGFGAIVAWAIAIRKNTGWHRRLMFAGMAILTGPGFGRILPMPLFIPFAWYLSILLPMIFVVVGMLADRRRYGQIHPAWFWGIAVVVGLQIVADLVAYSPVGYGFTEWFLEGTPGAERQMEAFFPPA